jgi:transposase
MNPRGGGVRDDTQDDHWRRSGQTSVSGLYGESEGHAQNEYNRDAGKLLALIARQQPALIVMEACSGAHDWARRVRALGHDVRLLAPPYVVPFRHGQNNDPNDALALTEAGRRPSIPSVPVKSGEQQDIQAWHRVRERLVKNRTA